MSHGHRPASESWRGIGCRHEGDSGRDAGPAEIDAYVDGMGLGRIDAFLTKQIFRHMLIKRAYTSDQFREMAAASRFGSCTIEESPIGLEVTLRK